MTLHVSNHNLRLLAYHFLDPLVHFDGFVNKKLVIDRNLTFIDNFSQFSTWGQDGYVHTSIERLTYCSVTYTCCFHEIILGSHNDMFYALTFAGSRGSCLNMRPIGRLLKHLLRNPASVNAMK